jgi:thiol-disulfide isomerase/thioredoxin
MRPVALGILAIGVLLIGAVAIVIGRPDGTRPADDSSPRTAPAERQTGDAFPIVAYQGGDLLGADELDFRDVLGSGRPVALNFWAGECPPCRAEMPAFQRVYERYEDRFLLVGVDIGPFVGLGSHESARALLEELGITYPATYALDARAVQDNKVLSMPTTVFYDGDGLEVGRVGGVLDEAAFERRVRDLIRSAR